MTEWNGKVTVDSKEYKIEWSHSRWDLDWKDMEVIQPDVRATTRCLVKTDAPISTVVEGGFSFCAWSDNFSRKVGRKLSLQRALLNSDFTQAQRKQVWDQVLCIKGLVK